MELFLTLAIALVNTLREFAGAKTRRYFIKEILPNNATNADDIPVAAADVVRTFIAILTCRHLSSMVETVDDAYPVSDYEFPSQWWDLARGRFVYTSRAAIAKAKSYDEVESVDGNILSPFQVSQFFEEYNANQGNLYKVVLAKPTADQFVAGATVNDFKALCYGDRMVHHNEAGTIEPEVAQVLEIGSPYTEDEEVVTFNRTEGRVIARWLMSVE